MGNRDFGTSPIFGQLSDKPLLACIWSCGVSDVKNNGKSRNYALIQFDDGVVRWVSYRARSETRPAAKIELASCCWTGPCMMGVGTPGLDFFLRNFPDGGLWGIRKSGRERIGRFCEKTRFTTTGALSCSRIDSFRFARRAPATGAPALRTRV